MTGLSSDPRPTTSKQSKLIVAFEINQPRPVEQTRLVGFDQLRQKRMADDRHSCRSSTPVNFCVRRSSGSVLSFCQSTDSATECAGWLLYFSNQPALSMDFTGGVMYLSIDQLCRHREYRPIDASVNQLVLMTEPTGWCRIRQSTDSFDRLCKQVVVFVNRPCLSTDYASWLLYLPIARHCGWSTHRPMIVFVNQCWLDFDFVNITSDCCMYQLRDSVNRLCQLVIVLVNWLTLSKEHTDDFVFVNQPCLLIEICKLTNSVDRLCQLMSIRVNHLSLSIGHADDFVMYFSIGRLCR